MITYGARKARLCSCCVDRDERQNKARARREGAREANSPEIPDGWKRIAGPITPDLAELEGA